MRSLTRLLLWLFAVSVPWELVTLPGVGAVSRLLGLAAMGAGILTIALEQRVRRPGAIFWLAAAFTLSSFLTLLWTISLVETLDRALTYAQLLGLVWLVPQFVRTREEQQSLLIAVCLGAFVPTIDLFFNYSAGVEAGAGNRYSSSSVNANDLGLILALGLPIAWYLMLHRRGAVRLMAWIYLPLAPAALLLTGTRGAFLAALTALLIVPLSLPRLSLRLLPLVGVLLAAGSAALFALVPAESWERISTIKQEMEGEASLTGRVDIWNAGWTVFLENPALGIGAGAFEEAVDGRLPLTRSRAPHNAPLAVLVEQGAVGLFMFAAVLAACGWTIQRLAPAERQLWAVLMLSWLVGVMSVGWQYRKLTWLFFAMLAAQQAVHAAPRLVSRDAASRFARPPERTFARSPGPRPPPLSESDALATSLSER